MRVDELIQFYRADARAQLLKRRWDQEGSKTELKGIVGSATPLLAASLFREAGVSESQANPPSHLFVLDDKETAAYFLNDLEQLLGKSHRILFFPRSARVPYQEEVT
jgi:transcription-repair coupling factor (superfamily II helicase)